jgi:hypothetical protein
VKALTWDQAIGWSLSQHSLSQRLKRQDFVTAVTQTGGIQAQVMSAETQKWDSRRAEMSSHRWRLRLRRSL